MSEGPYIDALKYALTESQKLYPGAVRRSFLFTKDGAMVVGDPKTHKKNIEETMDHLKNVAEKADAIGGLKTLHIDGKEGKLILTNIDDMFFALVASKNADATYLDSITRVIIPTILKLVKTVIPTPIRFAPSRELVVDTMSGFFVGDSVQIDMKILKEWSERSELESVDQVEIKSSDGKSMECKVKGINDAKLKDAGMIRIPESTCKTLKVKKGDLVKVKPI